MTTSSTRSHPDRFDQFYRDWFPKTVAIARKRGLSDAEAAAQEVLMAFVRQDYLDPEGRWSRWHDENFDSWVASIIYRRLISLQRTELRRKTIAPQVALVDQQIEYTSTEDVFTAFGQMKDLVRGVYRSLRRDRPDLVPLWVEIIRQFTFGDMTRDTYVSQKNLARELGVSGSEVSEMLADLREWLRSADGPGELIDRTFSSA